MASPSPIQSSQDDVDEGLDSKKRNSKPNHQIFNDPVHGFIELHPLLVKIINTPQFQRLKDIKQLGVCYWVFPGASHNRFEHCLGTAHLCGKMIDTLRELHEGEFEITENEALCVKIAGLCHDLGHGPFSHFFDNVYIPSVNPASNWKHEDASCSLFDLMIKENPDLKEALEDKVKEEKGMTFSSFTSLIKELIRGKDPQKDTVERTCRKSRKKKWFLYEIVANKRNGIDCDKFDYFARDSLNVGVKSNFDCQRYFHTICIKPQGDKLLIHVRDKEVVNLYELFHTRWSLHHRVYQHKTQAPIEDMLAKALKEVDGDLNLSKSFSEEYIHLYTYLTDSIFYQILRGGSSEGAKKNFKEAQKYLVKIQNRELYKLCGQLGMDADDPSPSREDIAKEIASKSTGSSTPLSAEDILVSVVYIHYGMKGKDPIENVLFFDKDNKTPSPREVMDGRVSKDMLPQKFHERFVRVYATKEEKIDQVKTAFELWKEEQTQGTEGEGGGRVNGETVSEPSPIT